MRKSIIIVLFLIVAIIYSVFYPIINAQTFTLDDDQYFIKNELVRNPNLASAARLFTEVIRPSTVGGYYQPIAMVSLMINCYFGASEENLKPVHISALTIHIINVCILFYLLYILFNNIYGAFIAAIFYGVHPLTVEVVAWVSEGKTLFATMFGLICILNYVLFSKSRKTLNYIISIIAFLLALMSKPTVIMIPFVLLIIDYWPLGNLKKAQAKIRLLEKLPYAALMVVSMIITFVSQAKTADVKSVEIGDLLFRILYVIGFYCRKFFYPLHLTTVSSDPINLDIWDYRILVGAVALGIIIFFAIESYKRTKKLLCAIGIFFTILLPTMGIVDYSFSIVWIKYMYFPIIAIAIINSSLLAKFYKNFEKGLVKKINFVLVNLAIGIVIGVCMVLTRNYIGVWKDSYTYLTYTLKYVQDSGALYGDYGIELQKRGAMEEAMKAYDKALKLKYDPGLIFNNIATIYAQKGNYEAAANYFKHSIEYSKKPLYLNNYALALKKLGKEEEMNKILEELKKFNKEVR